VGKRYPIISHRFCANRTGGPGGKWKEGVRPPPPQYGRGLAADDTNCFLTVGADERKFGGAEHELAERGRQAGCDTVSTAKSLVVVVE